MPGAVACLSAAVATAVGAGAEPLRRPRGRLRRRWLRRLAVPRFAGGVSRRGLTGRRPAGAGHVRLATRDLGRRCSGALGRGRRSGCRFSSGDSGSGTAGRRLSGGRDSYRGRLSCGGVCRSLRRARFERLPRGRGCQSRLIGHLATWCCCGHRRGGQLRLGSRGRLARRQLDRRLRRERGGFGGVASAGATGVCVALRASVPA